MKKGIAYFVLIVSFVWLYSCSDDPVSIGTPYQLDIPGALKLNFPPPEIPADNPLTQEGVQLGRKLFFDPILSANGTQACADCHAPSAAFTDNRRFSPGIDGIVGTRNSMPIFNACHSLCTFLYHARNERLFRSDSNLRN